MVSGWDGVGGQGSLEWHKSRMVAFLATLCVFIIAEHDPEAGSVRDLDLDQVDSTILCKRQ